MTTALPIRLAAGSGPTFGVDDLACAAATHLGLWAGEGLDVTWVPVRGGVAAMDAVLAGEVDVSYGGLGPVIGYRAQGRPCRVVVSMARGLAQNLVARSRLRGPEELRGASWGLNPGLRRPTLEELIATGFVAAALADLGVHDAPFDRPD